MQKDIEKKLKRCLINCNTKEIFLKECEKLELKDVQVVWYPLYRHVFAVDGGRSVFTEVKFKVFMG